MGNVRDGESGEIVFNLKVRIKHIFRYVILCLKGTKPAGGRMNKLA